MISTVTGTSAAGVIPLPSDLMGVLSLRVQYAGGSYELRPLPEAGSQTYAINSGLPGGYSVIGSNIVFDGG